jgi:UDP-GlcNAc:undecaprenyl-phosphate GlcNAc-1-phosphate transferase
MSYLAVLLASMFCTLVLLAPLRHFSVALGLIDVPNARKVHAQVIPRIGGMAMVPAWLFVAAVWMPHSAFKTGLLGAVAVLFIFCVLDDRFDLHYSIKLLGQLLAGIFVVVVGDLHIIAWPFIPQEIVPTPLSMIFTVLVIVAVINAMNLIDGLDGLAGGIALTAFGMVAMLAIGAGDAGLVIACVAAIGSLLGFLRYNGHPAVIFMGDSGSQFLGLVTAATGLLLTQRADLSLSPLLPLLLLAIPVADTGLVFLKRLSAGQPVFHADKRHIHHRLLALGLSHMEVVLALYGFQLVIVSGLFFMADKHDAVLAVYFVGIVLALAYLSAIQQQDRLRHLVHRLRACWDTSTLIRDYHDLRRVLDMLINVVVISVLIIFICSVLAFSVAESRDVALLATLLFLLSLWRAFSMREGKASWFDKLLAYVTGTVTVYAAMQLPADYQFLSYLLFLLLIGSFLGVLLLSPVSDAHYFRLTPTDMLLVAAVAVLPAISSFNEPPLYIGRYISQLIMVFYLLEYVYERGTARRYVLSGTQSVVCAALAFTLLF